MSKSAERGDPFPAFNFRLSIDDIKVAGFSECSGLNLEIEMFDYQEGGLNTYVHKLPTRQKQTNVVLKRGIVDLQLWDWYAGFLEGTVGPRQDLTIEVLGADRQTVMVWEIVAALPAKLNGPELNASQNNVAVETLELVHHGLIRLR